MKKVFVIGFILGLLVGAVTISFAANSYVQALLNQSIKVMLDGKTQVFKDEKTGDIQYPLTYNDRTYLPLRTVATLSGLKVEYDSETNTAILMTEEYENRQETNSGNVDNTFNNANFSTFSNKIKEVRWAFLMKVPTIKGYEAVEGRTRSDAQCFNYIACGQNEWLTREDAQQISFTKMEYVDILKFFDVNLDSIRIMVEDKNNNKIEASYYVTQEGDIFIWPPFEYKNEFYVNSDTKLTNSDGISYKANRQADCDVVYSEDFSFTIRNVDITF